MKMYKIKNDFEDYMEIYHDTFKILELSNGTLWNATEDSPIAIAKSRKSDYVVSNEPLEKEVPNEEVQN